MTDLEGCQTCEQTGWVYTGFGENDVELCKKCVNGFIEKVVAEKLLNWTSDNGNWQIVGQVKAQSFDASNLTHSIVLRRYDKERRGFMTYQLGIGRNMQKVPAYVLAKYNGFLDEIRVRQEPPRGGENNEN